MISITQGIYCIEINNKKYIGKDVHIDQNKRKKEHYNLLIKGTHYNKHLQRAFDKYKTFDYDVLIEFRDIDNETLSTCEMFYIDIFDTYNKGYNLTKGGEGGNGLRISKSEREKRSERYTGEKNPQSKLTNKQFFEIVEHLKQGKTNREIAKMYNIHERYISLIRHKKRFKKLWEQVKDYNPINSDEQLKNRGKVTEQMFKEIVHMIKNGKTNAEIERKFDLSSGTASRIRHKKLYKQWWQRFFNE
ncbi:nuclease [Bacillus smithii]|uniref:nuclease n=1 Tax=Bacillus smithii TaxID=1479 RepID=UPI003D1B3099